MATVSSIESLVNSLSIRSQTVGNHAWLDKKLGLVIGKYPTPSAVYDFGEERISIVNSGPVVEKPTVSFLEKAPRKTQKYELEMSDAKYVVGSATQLLIQGLNIIEVKYPGTLEKLSLQKKQTKRPVSLDREELYEKQRDVKYSSKLDCGYYVATNNKGHESEDYLREAAKLAGLSWGPNFRFRKI